MLGRRIGSNKIVNVLCTMVLSAFLGVQANAAQTGDITARSVLEKFNTTELNAYLTGLVQGFAHARYIKDGENADGGMACIYSWFFNDDQSMVQIIQAFRRYGDNSPNAVMAAMLKQQCGE